jgi:myo-inositol 2-dehydrogenase / D-chiro-inositol 1-dehydrogenase
MTTMRIGIVGTGRIGLMHARNFAQSDGVDEVVLMGRDPARIATAAERVASALSPGAPTELAGSLSPGGVSATVSTRVGPAVDLAGLDALVVATTTSTHPEFALLAARHGMPALVEKPLALDPDRLTSLADELDELGSPTMVAFHRRYDPAHHRLRQHIRAGDLGTVRAITATGHDRLPLAPDYIPVSGGIWLDMLIHEFDIIPWVTDQRVISVWATGAVLDAPLHADYGDVDTAVAVLMLESGATATVSGLRRNGAGQDVRLEVFGSANSFAAGFDAHLPMTSTEPDVAPPAAPHEQFIERFERAFRAEAAAFVDLVAGNGVNESPPRSGLPAVEIALAAAESVRTGSVVLVPQHVVPMSEPAERYPSA